MASVSLCVAQTEGPALPMPAPTPNEDWAKDYLAADPLAAAATVTLADLQAGLADPARRDSVIPRHLARAELTDDERRDFLREALANASATVQAQAAAELKLSGWLDEFVREKFLKQLSDGDVEARGTAIIGLEWFESPSESLPENYTQRLIEALADRDPLVRESAARQLERLGPAAVPALLATVDSGPVAAQRAAAGVLARIAIGAPLAREAMASRSAPSWPGDEAPRGKAAGAAVAEPQLERQLDEEHPKTVRVYFGTNRQLLREIPDPRRWLWLAPALGLAALALAGWRLRRRPPEAKPRNRAFTAALVLPALGVAGWCAVTFNDAWRSYYSQRSGAVFGPRRSDGVLYHGYCDVSLPPTHAVGQVEQPQFGAEDEQQHVVLRRAELLSDEQFVAAVREALDRLPRGQRECFVFVHGYNTTFDEAARRTAQIHYDLQFPGAPLFFSWPSRGSHLYYPADRSEIQYSHRYVQQFLLEAAEKLDADRVHVIAHSMGADAVGQAIAAMGDRGRLFDQIVLAAPDIDAGVFREQIAPRLASQARRTTLYCSKTDWALLASYLVNDLPRAGDSSRGILVIDEADTVDASRIDTSLLGHSYYGDCLPLLRDVRSLFEENLSPAERDLKENLLTPRGTYWTFAEDAPLP